VAEGYCGLGYRHEGGLTSATGGTIRRIGRERKKERKKRSPKVKETEE
jgi:hypothetical protein